ncbi:MAG: peroxiredoxin family protein, partial [Chloroflexi bacterium]|nr:peroxiredoxin family protein [Chloroflexota bacterium]
PGDKAPDFTIEDLEGKHHRLYDYLNGQKTVLLFYRGEWCPVCNLQLHSLQEKLAEFQKENAQILAVSTDTPENSQKLIAKHNLGFPVLAGLSRETVEAYDLFFNDGKGHAEPAVFILRPDGAVAYASLQSGPLGRPGNDDLLRIVRRVQAG